MSEVFIRTQNREKLMQFGISFNAIEYGTEQDKKEVLHHKLYISDGCLEEIAEYKTKERCIEVLDELQKECGSYATITGGAAVMRGGMNIQPSMATIPRVYEMPKE